MGQMMLDKCYRKGAFEAELRTDVAADIFHQLATAKKSQLVTST